ncbi:hypothetical protein BAL199_18461 [alpha proteobacterium BAL199]|nr:hypothetical protein BAL199_18461 [alpha proteobacterium BAL199]
MAATTDTSAATATLARSPWRPIRMDRSSFTSDAMATMDIPDIVGAVTEHVKMRCNIFFD